MRLRLTVSYLGTRFHGFAENAGVPTVGGVLRAAIEQVLGTAAELTCAGRTDAGVHAAGQVVTVDLDRSPDEVDLDRLTRSLNGLCGPDIVVRDLSVVPDEFDARRSATARTYRYAIVNRSVPDPFVAATSWHRVEPLDHEAIRCALRHLLGEHDFTSFCRRPKGTEPGEVSLVRRVHRVEWDVIGDRVRFEIEANAFCHQMVRSIVGTLVDLGSGRARVADLSAVLEARDRAGAGQLAPPRGLWLWSVQYRAEGWASDPDTGWWNGWVSDNLADRPGAVESITR